MSEQKNVESKVSENLEKGVENQDLPNENSDLILGKFKSVDDLKIAYQNLQKQQGMHSAELGELRKLKQVLQNIADKKLEEESQEKLKQEYIANYLSKYDNENYFQNEAFKNLYSSAFKALGTNLDTDEFVQKIEDYVASRILLNERLKNTQNENKNATDSLNFLKGSVNTSDKKLRLQDIPQSELEKYIAKYV